LSYIGRLTYEKGGSPEKTLINKKPTPIRTQNVIWKLNNREAKKERKLPCVE